MKKKSLLIAFVFASTSAFTQGLLNKLKNKANQEINKLEKGSSPQPPNKNKLSTNVTRTVVVTLGANEIFDYQENCIDLGASLNQVSFIVTSQNGSTNQCYTYKNGTRTPVSCPTGGNNGCQTSLQCSFSELRELPLNDEEIRKYVSNDTESHAIQQPTITDQQLKMMATYMTPAQIEEVKKNLAEAQKQTANQTYSTIKATTINFSGKKYGPYKQLGKFLLTADGNNFYALVGDTKDASSSQVQYKMITSASAKTLSLATNTMPTACFASSDNLDFGCVSFGITGQNFVVTTSAGKTYEVPVAGGFEKAWFSAVGNHVLYLSQNQLYRDGQGIKTFDNGTYVKPCDLFVSSDGLGVTLIKDNKVSFADGDYFEYPLKISIVYSGGKPYYKWLALENKEVVVYQKPY